MYGGKRDVERKAKLTKTSLQSRIEETFPFLSQAID